MASLRRSLAILALPLLLTACFGSSSDTDSAKNSSSSSSSSSTISPKETRNVSYSGIVRTKSISIYMEGTHRLDIDDKRFILLSSERVDLNGYVGENVEATGTVTPTVEEGGTIMRVESIHLLDESSSSASGAILAPSSSSSSEASSSRAASSSTAPSSLAASSKQATSSAQPSSSSSAAAASSAASQISGNLSLKVKSMASQNLAANNWTQAYCTSHLGFCFPIHRNWWFTSFGTAAQALWHVEVGSEKIENLGEGPLSIELVSGSLGSKGVSDGSLEESSGWVIGYKEWTENRHFEVRAPKELREAVSYVIQHITQTELAR